MLFRSVLSHVLKDSFTYHFTAYEYVRHMFFVGSKPPFWSIPPEIQFYGIFILIWWLAASGRLRRWWPAAAFAAALLILVRSVFPGIVVFSVLHIFLLGVTAGAARRALSTNAVSPRAALLVQVAALGLLLCPLAGIGPSRAWLEALGWHNDRSAYDSIALAILIAVCLFAFTFETKLARVLFANSLSRRLGAYSFSIYLLHEPVMAAVVRATADLGWPTSMRLALGFLVMLAISAASFAWFELPLQQRARGLVVRLLVRRGPAIDASALAPPSL